MPIEGPPERDSVPGAEPLRAPDAQSLQERYRLLAENIADVIFTLDHDMKLTYVSPSVKRLLGYSPEEAVALTLERLLTPRSLELAMRTWQEDRAQELSGPRERTRTLELEAIRMDGTTVWVEVVVSPMRDAEGRLTGILGVSRDITERKTAVEALKASEERYRSLVDTATAAVATTDIEGRFTFVNNAMCDLIGYSEEELLGRPFADFLHPEDLGKILELFQNAHARPELRPQLEFRAIRKDGSIVHCFSAPTISWHDGEIIGFNAILHNITKRKKAEEALRESEEKYHGLLDNLSDVVVELDSEGIFRYLSPQVEDVFGFGPEQMEGRSFAEFIHPDWHERSLKGIRRVLEEQPVHDFEFKCLHKDGRYLEASISARRVHRDGKATVVGIIKDISERKRSEEALRTSEEKFRRLFETSPEGMVMLDLEGVVTDMNEAARKLQDIPREKLIGHRFEDFASVPEDELPRYLEMFRKLAAGEQFEPVEVRLQGEGGEQWLEVFPALLEKNGAAYALQVILRDITERKRAHLEMLARLMKYELDEGNLYLVKESSPRVSVDSFRDLLMAGYRGAVVSRTPFKELHIDAGEKFEHRWLSEKGGPDSLRPRLEDIERWLDGLPRGQALLVDRLDYIISKNGLSGTLHFIHRLRELAYIMGHVVIISLDPATVEGRFLRALDKETLAVEPRERPTVTADQRDILDYIHRQSLLGVRPTLTELGRALKLSKPTARKKVRDLVHGGYLALSPRGRTKVLELTDLGRRVFQA
jgi:PAS domain S-box-containing protein